MGRNSRGAEAHLATWPKPAGMRTTAEFLCGLKTVRTRSGRSFTELAEQSKVLGYPLARSTLHKLCKEEKLPATFVRVEHFLRTCGVPAEDIGSWREAYHRVRETPEVVAAEPMPVGEVSDYVAFPGYESPAGVRPSLTWLATTFLCGTVVGGALVAWLT